MDVMLLNEEVAGLEEEASLRSTSETWSIRRVLSDPTVRLPLLLVVALQAGQQLSGINAVFYYSNSIFESAGMSGKESQYATLGTGVANCLMAVISVSLMTIYNRRSLLFYSCVLSIVCLTTLCFAIVFIVSIIIIFFFYDIYFVITKNWNSSIKLTYNSLTESSSVHVVAGHSYGASLCDHLRNRPWANTLLYRVRVI